MNIIGLGRAGCEVARKFENYGQYKIFYADTENRQYSTFLSVKVQNSHEEYEKNYKKLSLSSCEGKTTLILSGAGKISGCTLRLLEQIRHLPLEVIYIKSDESTLSGEAKIRDRIVFGILQQYARSNKLNKLYVISNRSVESIAGDVSIMNYWDEINNVISSTYHMINVFENTEPLLTSSSILKETAKIGTFGVVGFKTEKERLFYDLKFARIKNYFYGVNKEALENDKEILHRIRTFVESKKDDKSDVGFSIFSTDYEDNYVYSAHFASFVQEQTID